MFIQQTDIQHGQGSLGKGILSWSGYKPLSGAWSLEPWALHRWTSISTMLRSKTMRDTGSVFGEGQTGCLWSLPTKEQHPSWAWGP